MRSTPRRISSICSATDFMTNPSTVHLKTAHGLKSLRIMDDPRFALARRPGNGEDVKAGGMAEQAALAQEVQSELRQTVLLDLVNGGSGAEEVVAGSGANFDEDDR